MKIYITKNFCDCNLCKGSKRIKTLIDKEAYEAFQSGSHNQIITGSRNPTLITFPCSCDVVYWSKDKGPDQNISCLGEAIFKIHTSKFGCYKITKNQQISIHIPIYTSIKNFIVIYTR